MDLIKKIAISLAEFNEVEYESFVDHDVVCEELNESIKNNSPYPVAYTEDERKGIWYEISTTLDIPNNRFIRTMITEQGKNIEEYISFDSLEDLAEFIKTMSFDGLVEMDDDPEELVTL